MVKDVADAMVLSKADEMLTIGAVVLVDDAGDALLIPRDRALDVVGSVLSVGQALGQAVREADTVKVIVSTEASGSKGQLVGERLAKLSVTVRVTGSTFVVKA